MQLGNFVVKNAFRNKRRTLLTVSSIGFSLLLLMALRTVLDFLFSPPVSPQADLRLTTQGSTYALAGLPLAYGPKLEQVPGVKSVLAFQIYGGRWKKEPERFFPTIAVEPEAFFRMFPELHIDEGVKTRFREVKTGCIVGDELMSAVGWKLGDKVSMEGSLLPVDLDCEIVGVYHSNYRSTSMFLRADYLYDSMPDLKTTSWFWLMADKAEELPGIAKTVDEMFRNSPAPTLTQTEKAFLVGFTQMMGNLQFLIGAIGIVVVFTMLLVTASNMAMTVRERLREIAILKALGYPRRTVLLLILGEAGFIAFLGGGFAAVAALILRQIPLYNATHGMLERLDVTPDTVAIGVGIGVAIGIVSAVIPAVKASRLTITQGLKQID